MADEPQQASPQNWLADRIVSVTHGPDYARDGASVRMDPQNPFLTLQFVTVYVHDQERSLRFFVDQLGFRLILDVRFASGHRWIQISPPDGTAGLALMRFDPLDPDDRPPGQSSAVTFFTEDISAKFKELRDRGVKFTIAPQTPAWGGTFCRFEDPDGNSFVIAGFDEITEAVERRRRQIAEQQEAERRAAQELEIAIQVQARLFPQRLPAVPGLDYAGLCRQARSVGGDYYDFLDLGSGRIGLVVGDIAGKGMAAALLMANLQANLRSQSACAVQHPESVLHSVNRLLYENTEAHAYATLFFGEFEHDTGRMRYANCGHLPGLIVRRDGAIERLDPTCTVIGMFENWQCSLAESRLDRGDLLALYTDGLTEFLITPDEEFGETRLKEAMRRHSHLRASEVIDAILDEVNGFSTCEQCDDITLIVAKRF